jgi:hypothetical protein
MLIRKAFPRALRYMGGVGISPLPGVGLFQEEVAHETGLDGNMLDGLFSTRQIRECVIKGESYASRQRGWRRIVSELVMQLMVTVTNTIC